MTGESGGKMVACYLYQLLQSNASPIPDAMAWLRQVAALPLTHLRPATKACIAKAMDFYPKLEAAFAVEKEANQTAELEAEIDGLF